ncbi:MAG: polyisoprenoid-binding protein [Acidobacteria bacterium]|nr:polyisoprenoid-binding protein [Acidobacteriota bacterium]
MRTHASALVLSLVLASGSAVADVENYRIDPGHSSVGFKVQHMLSKVPGRFMKYSGTIAVDPKDLATAKIAVEIDPASINTDNSGRDESVRSAEFFDVEKFPKMAFESTSVVPTGATHAAVKGNLTLHGVTRPVELDVEILGFAADPWGGYRAAFEAKGVINRKDFGMTWNKVLDSGGLLVGESVEIDLNVEAVRQGAAAPAKAGAKSGR